MNRWGIIIVALLVFIPFALIAEEPATLASINDIRVITISASDKKAVIKTPDGKTTIIKAGDPIGERATVVEIADNRVVLKHKIDEGSEMIIIRLVNGKQTIESIRKSNLKQPVQPMRPMSPN